MNHSPSMMVLLGESLLESNGLKITTSVTQQDFFFPSESIRFEQPSLLHIPESEYRFLVATITLLRNLENQSPATAGRP